jgi:hypothetical protein
MVFAAVLAEWRLVADWRFVRPAISGALESQIVFLAMVAALWPGRAICGLAIATGITFLRELVTLRKIGLVEFYEVLHVVMVLAVVQGLRLAAGWRLTIEPCENNRRGQFQIAELLELTTTIAVALGCFVYLQASLPPRVRDNFTLLECCIVTLPTALIGVPVALTILAEMRPGKWTILAVALWCVLVATAAFFADLRHSRTLTIYVLLALFLRGGALYLTMFVAGIALNALALRMLGYRWRTDRVTIT